MKIVKFKDGTYGVRKGCWLFGYEFLAVNGEFWFTLSHNVLENCRFSSLKAARGARDSLTLCYEVVE